MQIEFERQLTSSNISEKLLIEWVKVSPYSLVIEVSVNTSRIFSFEIFCISLILQNELAISWGNPSVSANPGQSHMEIYFPHSFLMTSRGVLVFEPYLTAIPSPFIIISPLSLSYSAIISIYANPFAIVLFPDPVVPINSIAWSTGLFIDLFPSESNFLISSI